MTTTIHSALPSLLIVDDDPLISDGLSFFLGQEYSITTFSSRTQTVEHLRNGYQPDLALIDLGLPPHPHRPDEGYQLIGDLLAHAPDTRIVMLTGQNEESHARHARTLGAVEFVAKPADPEHLRQLLKQVLALTPAAANSLTDASGSTGLVGKSPPMIKLRAQIQQYADSPFPVLIEGESGSGKEVVARLLHYGSSRADKPLLALNCAAISPSLVETTLFGHAKGAFTGANQAKAGYFEEAAEGALFLDEIGELPLELQPKLLRVLENGEYQRVGDTSLRHSQARVITATNRDLRQEVRDGRFRADLYHRLSVLSVNVPPLRELGADKERLLDHFSAEYAQQAGTQPFVLTPAARLQWVQYPFPGNVRELRNIVIRLTAKYPGQDISPERLSEEFDADLMNSSSSNNLQANILRTYGPQEDEMLAVAIAELERDKAIDLDAVLKSWEKAYIEAAQRLTQGNMSQTAKILGVNRTTLYNRIETLPKSE